MTDPGKLSSSVLENESRRKAVKTIVGGVTVLAAYHTMPVKWGKPIIEQVFLPAHAATSGSSLNDPCTVTHVDGPGGTDSFLVEGYVTPPTAGLPTTIVMTPSLSGSNLTPVTATTTTKADGTFSATLTTPSGSDRVDVRTTVEGADGSASCFSVRPAEETCNNITFTVDNQTAGPDIPITVTYENCEGGEIAPVNVGFGVASFSVHPSRNVTLFTPDYVLIDDGEGGEIWDEDTTREINPAEHPVVTISNAPM